MNRFFLKKDLEIMINGGSLSVDYVTGKFVSKPSELFK